MKSLIIYYSHIGENYMEHGIENITKGNTEIVAEYLKELTSADIFRVEPINEYSFNYKKCCDEALKDLKSDIRRKLKSNVVDINDYDVIYIGGPVWWGHLPVCMFDVLDNLDFTSKIIKPFTTHEGSGLGNVMEDIQKHCKNGVLKEGLAIRGCKVKDSTQVIKDWINK